MTSRYDIPSANEPSAAGLLTSYRMDHLNVQVYDSSREAVAAIASAVRAEIRRRIADCGRAIGLFAAGPSQDDFLDELVKSEDIEWTRVIGFHLQEFLGISENAPVSSRSYLLERLVMRVPMAEFHGIRGEAANPDAVCANYTALLKSRPPDFAILDLGENNPLARIAPPNREIHDSASVKVIHFDETYRRQLAERDGFVCFNQAPRGAISVTIPTVLACPRLFSIATGASEQQVIREIIEGPLGSLSPAPVLRLHPDAHLFLDREAASLLLR